MPFSIKTLRGWFVLALAAVICPSLAKAYSPIGYIYAIYDYQVGGCAYDADDLSAILQVHVYAEPNFPGVIGIAAYPDSLSSDPKCDGHAFGVQFRRPVNDPSTVTVSIWAPDQISTWLPTAGVPMQNVYNRSVNTFFYENGYYKAGISTSFGAIVTEYYNKYVDSGLNLIYTDPGSAFQTALFAAQDSPVLDAGTNCRGIRSTVWNPTQAGTFCWADPHPGSEVPSCTSSNPSWCGRIGVANANSEVYGSGQWIQWLVHFKNFYYPGNNSYPYQSYDDVYGYVRYTFEHLYMQVDQQLWRNVDPNNPATNHGVRFQQLPVVFLTQMTQFTTTEGVSLRDTDGSYNAQLFNIEAATGRWITAESVVNPNAVPAVPVMSPGDYVTFAFYTAPNKNGTCLQNRAFQMDFYAPGIQHASAI